MSNFKTPRVIKIFSFLHCFFWKICELQRKYSKVTKDINCKYKYRYKYVQFKYHDSYDISISESQVINELHSLISIMTLSHHNISIVKSQLGFPLFVLVRSRKSHNPWKGYTLYHYWQHNCHMIYVSVQ